MPTIGKRWSSPIHVTERWAQSWSRCRGRWLFKSSPGSRLPILSARPVLRPVPSYTAWWQRHIGVNNLPKVVTQFCPSEIEPMTYWLQFQCFTATPRRHLSSITVLHCLILTTVLFTVSSSMSVCSSRIWPRPFDCNAQFSVISSQLLLNVITSCDFINLYSIDRWRSGSAVNRWTGDH